MKKIKIILLMLMFTAGMLILSACSGGEADEEVQEQKKESNVSLSQFASENGETWGDSWSTDTASGASMDIKVNALIEVPELKQMSTVEVQKLDFNEENKKKIAEAIFDGELYYYDEEHLPVTQIRELLDTWQKNKRFKEVAEEAEERVKKYEKLLKEAPDDFVKVEGDYKSDRYMGKRDGVQYYLEFDDTHDSEEHISMSPYNPYPGHSGNQDVRPDELKDEENVLFSSADIGLESENKCKVTKAEAEKTARELLQKAGFTDLILTKEQTLEWTWGGINADEDERNYRIDGWCFTFSPSAEDAPLSDYVEFYDYFGNAVWNASETEATVDPRFSPDCSYTVHITDKGVIGVGISNPIMILSSTPGVKLLPLDNIKTIIMNEIGGFLGFIQEEKKISNISYNRLTLGYYRVSNPEHKDQYTYVPAWRLWHNSGNNLSFVVNAMDGSVIEDWAEKRTVVSREELYKGEELW